MARTILITTIGERIATMIRDARASYVPPQKVVEYEEYWQYPATKTKIDARLPGTFVQLDSGSLEDLAGGEMGGTVKYRVNHIFPLLDTGNLPTQGSGAIQKTIELFGADEGYDLGIDTTGFEIQRCFPAEFGLSDELMEFGLAWAFCMLEVTCNTSP